MSLPPYLGYPVLSRVPPLSCLPTAGLNLLRGLVSILVVLARVTQLTDSSSCSRLPECPELLSTLVRAACTSSARLRMHGVGPFCYVVWHRRQSSVSCGVRMARFPPRTAWENVCLPVRAISWTPVPVCRCSTSA